MRENMGIYRGQTKDGEWVEGYYMQIIKPSHSILEISTEKLLNVLPETVGEWTGMKDKNGKRIFEGDIVFADFCESEDTLNDFSFTGTYVVKWGDDNYPSFDTDPWIDCECNGLMFLIAEGIVEVIGNITDNKLEDFNAN